VVMKRDCRNVEDDYRLDQTGGLQDLFLDVSLIWERYVEMHDMMGLMR
jgi:hypothetical protein